MSMIPLPWKIGGIAFVLLVLAGAYFGWQAHERLLGAAAVELADAKAVAAQAVRDREAAAKLLVTLQANLTRMQAIASAGNAKIDLEPVVPGSPAEIDAAAAIRCLLQKTDCK